MKNKVNLHFSSTHRGPGKVVENLVKGLISLGIDVTGNMQITEDSYQGCLQAVPHLSYLPSTTLMGPNLFIFPSEWGDFCQKFPHFIVPSEWVRQKYSSYAEMSRSTIDVWPVGIDTDSWGQVSKKEDEILVYFKSREESDLYRVTSFLEKENLKFNIIRYGSYDERSLRVACEKSSACILITGTESQGIAYMQILSSGIPCFVLNKSKFDYFHYKDSPIDATSVPYFNEMCGEVFEEFSIDAFRNFYQKRSTFDPRSFILGEFTLKKCAEKYIDIFLKYE